MLRRFISAKRRAQRRALGARQAQQRRVAVQALLHDGMRSRVFRKELAPAPARKVVFRHTPPKVQLLFHVAEHVAQLKIFLRQRLQQVDRLVDLLGVLALKLHLVRLQRLILRALGVLALDLPLVAQQCLHQRVVDPALVQRRRRRRRRKRVCSEAASGVHTF